MNIWWFMILLTAMVLFMLKVIASNDERMRSRSDYLSRKIRYVDGDVPWTTRASLVYNSMLNI